MAQPLNRFEGVRMALAVSIFVVCACRGNAVRDQQTAVPAAVQTGASTSSAPATASDVAIDTSATALQVGKKPAPGSTPTSTGEAGPPPRNKPAATATTPVAVTGTHLAPPP